MKRGRTGEDHMIGGVSGLVGWAQGKKDVAKRIEIESRMEGWHVEQRDKIEWGGMV